MNLQFFLAAGAGFLAAVASTTSSAASQNHQSPQSSTKTAEVVVVRSQKDGRLREKPVVSGSGQTFRDCDEEHVCPEMVVVPPSDGVVMLGTLDPEEPEYATKKILRTNVETFAIGKHEVSVAEYGKCVEAGKCRQPEWLEEGSQFHIKTGRNNYYRRLGDSLSNPDAPITGVSWEDATAYTQWLSTKTGQNYRLPSDAEWEYAARAGTRTAFWWGEEPKRDGKAMAACRGCDSGFDTDALAPVSAFPANAWGLHNVHGNVWEWVADYYCDQFRTSPRDGSAREEDNCAVRDAPGLRVLRGGSSFYEPRFMRSSKRLRNRKSFRNFSVGFRVARTVIPSVPPKRDDETRPD